MTAESGYLTSLLPNLQAADRVKLHNALAATGAKVGASATSTVGFFGTTPAVQPAATNQAAITDSSGGTVGTALASTLGRVMMSIEVPLMTTIADGDYVTDFIPGFAGKIVAVDWVQGVAVTNASKLSNITVDVEATPTTGGVVPLTSAACTPLGKVINGSAITAANTFTAAEKITVKFDTTTAFLEGSGHILLTLQNDDMCNAIASLAALQDEIRTGLVALGVLKGAA